MKLVTSCQMRKIEQIAAEELGIPLILLMENASIRAAGHCIKFLEKIENPKALIVCGCGSNGGDGMAVARHLHVKGIYTKVVYAGDMNLVKGDAEVNYKIVKNLEIPAEPVYSAQLKQRAIDFELYDLVVDALFGTGLSRNIEGGVRQLIESINSCAKYVISVDMPSGVHSDTGRIMGCAEKANETVTLGFPKTGLYLYPGAEYAGVIHIEDIAVPLSLIDRIETKAGVLTDNEARKLLPARKRRSNKGDFGKTMVFAGSAGMPGAAALVCSAAYMTGSGLVCACVTQNTATVIHRWQREAVTRIVPDINGMYCMESITQLKQDEIKSADVIVLGPGIGRSREVSEFVYEILKIAQSPIVLDADALFAVSENINILKEIKAPCIITPHPGEMSRLTNLPVAQILNNIAETAVSFAKEFNVVTILKDAHTVIADTEGNVNINITGNNALSKAGTGDVLTGMIAGFIAQGKNVFDAGILGAHFHGKACEAACLNKSRYSITASDLIDHIPVVMKT